MAWKAIPTRPHVKPSHQVMTLIAPSHCWHFDAWLYEYTDDTLLLLVQTRAGGRELLSQHGYTWDGERLRYTTATPNGQSPVTVQDKAYWPRSAELARLHSYVMQMIRRPRGFKSQSVALHYVRAPDLAPFDGTETNWQQ